MSTAPERPSHLIEAAIQRLEDLISDTVPGPWEFHYVDGDIEVRAGKAIATNGGAYSPEEMIYAREGEDVEMGSEQERMVHGTARYIAALGPGFADGVIGMLRATLDLARLPTALDFAAVRAALVLAADLVDPAAAGGGQDG
jgi:hypothetical protein